jgi:predicted Zn-dependent protease
MQPLQPSDRHHLAAAEGWLGLDCPSEARLEWENLPPQARLHPESLAVEYHIHEASARWDLAIETARAICERVPETPFGWVHLAFALHELKRTREAYDTLLPVVNRFPEDHIIRYNLACYCCQMGNAAEAKRWLRKAIAVVGADEIKKLAADDPDLQPLWPEISRINS